MLMEQHIHTLTVNDTVDLYGNYLNLGQVVSHILLIWTIVLLV